jgi:hypothetical protein
MSSAARVIGWRSVSNSVPAAPLNKRNDCSSENRISIPDQILWRLPWKGFSNLLRRPLFTRVIRYITLKCVTRRRSCDKTMKTNSTRKVAVGTMKKSIEAICFL